MNSPTTNIIKQLTSVLNFALQVQCQREAAVIRNCIDEINRLQQQHIPRALHGSRNGEGFFRIPESYDKVAGQSPSTTKPTPQIQILPCDITREQAAQFKNIPIIGYNVNVPPGLFLNPE